MESFDLISVALRAASYYAVLRVIGVALAPLWTPVQESAIPVVRHGPAGWTVLFAIALAFVHRLLDATRLAGEWGGIWDLRVQHIVWRSSAGTGSLTTIVGLALIGTGATRSARTGRALSVAGTVIAVTGFALTGHTARADWFAPLHALVPLHLLLLAFWVGGIVILSQSVRADAPREVAALARAFSRIAVWAVPPILAIGLIGGYLLVPGLDDLRTAYGGGLIGKLAIYATLLSVAAFNRFSVLRRLTEGTPRGLRVFARTLHVEHALLAIATFITACMTTIWGLGAH